jgi:hypothetical protein
VIARPGIVLCILASCAPYAAPAPVTGGRVATVGCYDLSFGTWSPTSGPDSLSPGPAIIELLVTGAMTPGWVRLRPQYTLAGSWTLGGTDSLVLTWSDGSNGITVSLKPQGENLAGHAQIWYGEGFAGSQPTAAVTARRVKCQ